MTFMLRKSMPAPTAPFLTAEWRNLAVLNFEVAGDVLAPLVPRGTELDAWQGKCYLSLVGFRFLKLRVLSVPIPFHRDFDEVNLRFYVRRRVDGAWRRAVVFVRELAPHRAVAWTARRLFGENYRTVRLGHYGDLPHGNSHALARVGYHWRLGRRRYKLETAIRGAGRPLAAGSFEEFIIDHLWGCSGGAARRTIEYRVEHRPWRYWPACESKFEGNVAHLYGDRFAEALGAPAAAAFVVDGSPVTLFRGAYLDATGPGP